jgi:hypothetical protein
MQVIDMHIFHQPEVFLITGIITRWSTLQRRFIGEIGGIAYAPEKYRGLLPEINELCSPGYKPGRYRFSG